MNCILPVSSVHVILQARILEWDLGAYHLSKNVLGPARILSGGKHAPCLSLPALLTGQHGQDTLEEETERNSDSTQQGSLWLLLHLLDTV